jgi:F0F1-type ATP synthase membrane subunit b/b'
VAALTLVACGGQKKQSGEPDSASTQMDSLEALTQQVETLSKSDTVNSATWATLRTQYEALSAKVENGTAKLTPEEKDLLTKLENRFVTAESTVDKKIESAKSLTKGTVDEANQAVNGTVDAATQTVNGAVGTVNGAVDKANQAVQKGVDKANQAVSKAKAAKEAVKSQVKSDVNTGKAKVQQKKKEVDNVKTSAKNLGDAIKGLK